MASVAWLCMYFKDGIHISIGKNTIGISENTIGFLKNTIGILFSGYMYAGLICRSRRFHLPSMPWAGAVRTPLLRVDQMAWNNDDNKLKASPCLHFTDKKIADSEYLVYICVHVN